MIRLALIKLVLHGFALLPLPWNHSLGALLGRALYRLPTSLKAVSSRNIQRCFPELSASEQDKLVRASLMEAGKTVTETGPMWLWNRPKLLSCIRDISGIEWIEAGQQAGKGIILAVPHLGCWEIIGRYYLQHGPLTALYRPPRLKELEPLIIASRQQDGTRTVPTTAKGVKQLYQALRENQCVGILPDQDPGRGAGVFAPFFGIPANTMRLLPRLAHKSGAMVLFAFAQRLPRGEGYHLHFIPAHAQLAGADLESSATSLNQSVEECIRMVPEQYQWGYKRFKTRPPGEKKFY